MGRNLSWKERFGNHHHLTLKRTKKENLGRKNSGRSRARRESDQRKTEAMMEKESILSKTRMRGFQKGLGGRSYWKNRKDEVSG